MFYDDAATFLAAVKNSFDLDPRLSLIHTPNKCFSKAACR